MIFLKWVQANMTANSIKSFIVIMQKEEKLIIGLLEVEVEVEVWEM